MAEDIEAASSGLVTAQSTSLLSGRARIVMVRANYGGALTGVIKKDEAHVVVPACLGLLGAARPRKIRPRQEPHHCPSAPLLT